MQLITKSVHAGLAGRAVLVSRLLCTTCLQALSVAEVKDAAAERSGALVLPSSGSGNPSKHSRNGSAQQAAVQARAVADATDAAAAVALQNAAAAALAKKQSHRKLH